MKNKFAKLTALLLTLVLLLGLAAGVSASEETPDYSDVKESAWYYEPVMYVTEKGLMNGVGGGKFAPNCTMSRAMAVTVIYRLAGSPEVPEDAPTFDDVTVGSYYEAPVKWAAANGITNGTSKTTFEPHKPVTREQFGCFIIRYAQSINAPCVTDEWYPMVEQAFEDSDTISSWAKEAMVLMIGLQLYRGDENEFVHPKNNITRAEASAILMRYLQLPEEWPLRARLIIGTDCMEYGFEDLSSEHLIKMTMEETTYLVDYLPWVYPGGNTHFNGWKESEGDSFTPYYRVWRSNGSSVKPGSIVSEYRFPEHLEDFNGLQYVDMNGNCITLVPENANSQAVLEHYFAMVEAYRTAEEPTQDTTEEPTSTTTEEPAPTTTEEPAPDTTGEPSP